MTNEFGVMISHTYLTILILFFLDSITELLSLLTSVFHKPAHP